jgi:hypothetical protein
MFDVLEIVNSPVKSPKCVRTQNEQELEALALNEANQTVWFSKSDGLVSSALVAVRGTVCFHKGVFLPAKWHLTRGRNKIHDNSRICGGV